MTTEEDDKNGIEGGGPEGSPSDLPVQASETADADLAPAEFGVERYVHAAFFSAGLLAAYLAGKMALSAWNALADWPDAVRSLPWLIAYSEEERGTFTLVIGAVLGVLVVLRYYRRPAVRSWATEVAAELARVTWPSKETVTNGTLVVLIAGAVATIYVTLLDRFWGYLTNLVYGA
jgi:preprotein translocase subunit SecE